MNYLRWEPPHEVTRTVEPYGVVLRAGQWYLVARHSSRFRTYRVSRIRDLHTLDEPFERTADFDLADYWRAYLADFDDRRHRIHTAVLRLSPEGMRWLPYLLKAVARAAQDTASPDRDGWTRVTVPVASHESAIRELLRFGPDVEVIAPDRLRTRITEILKATIGKYHRAPEPGETRRHSPS